MLNYSYKLKFAMIPRRKIAYLNPVPLGKCMRFRCNIIFSAVQNNNDFSSFYFPHTHCVVVRLSHIHESKSNKIMFVDICHECNK